MNILISEKLFDQLHETVGELVDELHAAQDECTLQEDIDSLEQRLGELGKLYEYCTRVKAAAKHGRAIKGQLEMINNFERTDE